MDRKELREKLNDMFDINGAVITKTQCCPGGRWWFTLPLTLFFSAVYAFMVWRSYYLERNTFIFVTIVLSVALLYAYLRLWISFISDILGGRFAECTVMLRRGEERYYYTRGRFIRKFEYDSGFISARGDIYDKLEDKKDYSPLAGRYHKSLQRRSSLYSTIAPSFWFDMLKETSVTVAGNTVTGVARGTKIVLRGDDRGRISSIEYSGKAYFLYDSVSPIYILDGKIPGRYRIIYKFKVGELDAIKPDKIFARAIKDYLWKKPSDEYVKFVPLTPLKKWLNEVSDIRPGQDVGSEVKESPNIFPAEFLTDSRKTDAEKQSAEKLVNAEKTENRLQKSPAESNYKTVRTEDRSGQK